MDKPYYPHQPIGSVDALAKVLGIHPKILVDLSNRVNDSYTSFEIQNKNKKPRIVYEPKYELKRIQKRINSRIFENVKYPRYLVGGIKDKEFKRDYVVNATAHGRNDHLISLDIKKFFDNIRPKYVESIFKYLFKFPPCVTDILTKLVTYRNKVPQGACSSTYVANLLFFNSEYQIVSSLRGKGITYTRLLDDVTLSSGKVLSEDEVTSYIKSISALFRKYELKLNNKKTKNERRSDLNAKYEVTGLWVGHKKPKARRTERNKIRHSVYICEQEFSKSSVSDEYHTLWNETSGAVAKLKRLGHSQHKRYRERLSKALPTYDEDTRTKIIMDVNKLRKIPGHKHVKLGIISRVNKIYYRLGILGRTDKPLAKSLRTVIKNHYKNMNTKAEMWE